MNILLVTATKMEMEAIAVPDIVDELNHKGIYITSLVTSPGILFTAFAMGKILTENKFDYTINAGIAGSFNRSIELGSVVQIKKEILADMGAENDDRLLSAFEIGLFQKDEFPFTGEALLNSHSCMNRTLNSLPEVNGITVNKVHGNETSIKQIIEKYNPDVESMEGAAFFYASLVNKLPFCEIRAISNYIEKRDRSKWNIGMALQNMGITVKNLLLDITY